LADKQIKPGTLWLWTGFSNKPVLQKNKKIFHWLTDGVFLFINYYVQNYNNYHLEERLGDL
jgi:hypothetical protein